jgi:hypothetical protein
MNFLHFFELGYTLLHYIYLSLYLLNINNFTIYSLLSCPVYTLFTLCYRGADKSLTRPTSRCILFDDENISFDASFVIYINSNNIPPIMIINRIHEHQNSSVAVACFLPGRAKDLSTPLYK